GGTRTPEYLARNPNGKVPMLELDDGRVLVESNAILHWLADGTPFLPSDPWQRAQALSCMFFEQYSHEPCIAVARFICGWTPPDSPRRAELPRLRERGHHALAVMERPLGAQRWFTGAEDGVADIALFGYTAVADDGGFDLSGYPAAGGAGLAEAGAGDAWLRRHAATVRTGARLDRAVETGRLSGPPRRVPANRRDPHVRYRSRSDPRPHARRQPRRGVRRQLPGIRAWLGGRRPHAAGRGRPGRAGQRAGRARLPRTVRIAADQPPPRPDGAGVAGPEQGLLHHRLQRPRGQRDGGAADPPHRPGVPALPQRRVHGRAFPQAARDGPGDGFGAVLRRVEGRPCQRWAAQGVGQQAAVGAAADL